MSVLFTRIRPKWFTPVAQLGILWYAAACFLVVAQYRGMAADYAPFSAAEQQLLASQPSWLLILQALGLLIGFWGAFMLATKKTAAIALLTLTFITHIGLLAQRLLATDAWSQHGQMGINQPLLMALVSTYLLFLTYRAATAGWLR